MRNTKKHIQVLLLMFVITLIFIGNITIYAAVTNHTTGSLTASNLGGSCPRCSWHYGGNYASGVRMSLYKYDGKGNPIKCGDSIDLLNTAKTIESGSLITGGYGRLDYAYGGKKVTFSPGYVNVN